MGGARWSRLRAAAGAAWRRGRSVRPRTALAVAVAAALALALLGAVFAPTGRDAPQAAAPAPPPLSRVVEARPVGGERALALARRLEREAFADAPVVQDPPDGPVRAAEFTESARESFRAAAAPLLQDPETRVRESVARAADPRTRAAGLAALWAIAEEGGPSAGLIWRFCAALAAGAGEPRAGEALTRARAANPQDRRLWRMLAFTLHREGKVRAARGAALVGQGLAEAAAGQAAQADRTLEQALPLLGEATSRAFVLGRLGDAAARRDDWSAAARYFRRALELRTRARDGAGIGQEASKLARAEAAQGRMAQACAALARAREQGVRPIASGRLQSCAAPASLTPAPG